MEGTLKITRLLFCLYFHSGLNSLISNESVNYAIIASDNGLQPERRQAIT